MANKKPDNQSILSQYTSEPNVATTVASSTTTSKKTGRKRKACSWRVAMLATPKYVTSKYQQEQHCCCHQIYPKQEEQQQQGEQEQPQQEQLKHDKSKKEQPKEKKKIINKLNRLENITSTERIEYLSRPHLRSLYTNKHSFSGNPNVVKDFEVRMDKHINNAWNSIYNEYRKAKHDEGLKIETKNEEFTKNASTSPRASPPRELSVKKGRTSAKNQQENSIKIIGKSKNKGKKNDSASKKSKASSDRSQKSAISKRNQVVKKFIQPIKGGSNMNILYKYEF